jgi:hypothetical protein
MKAVSRLKPLAPFLAFVILFITFFLQLSADACPLHGKHERHSPNSGLSSPGSMCLCLLAADLAPPVTGLPFLSAEQRIDINPASGRIVQSRIFDIFHPPRPVLPI